MENIPAVSEGSDRVTLNVLPGLRVCEPMDCNGQLHNSLFIEDKESYLSWSMGKRRHEITEQTTHIFRVEIHEKSTHLSEFHFAFTSAIISCQSENYLSNVKGKAEVFPYSSHWDEKESAPSHQISLHRTQKAVQIT